MAKDDIAIIKKYANRRLYNTQTSIYVTLEDLYKMVLDNEHFKVVDAKSGQDLTQSTLAQIIFDEEARGGGMLPVNFMWNIIRMYDDNLKSVVPHYLEASLEGLMQNQQDVTAKMQEFMMGKETFDVSNPFKGWEDLSRKNMEMMQQTFQNMNPFLGAFQDSFKQNSEEPASNADIDELKEQIENLTAENAKLKADLKKAQK